MTSAYYNTILPRAYATQGQDLLVSTIRLEGLREEAPGCEVWVWARRKNREGWETTFNGISETILGFGF